MLRSVVALSCALLPLSFGLQAEEADAAKTAKIDAILTQHVLPNFEALAQTTATLATVAHENCSPDSEALQIAYHNAFDAWTRVSHLRFGPSEVNNRAFALAFWPDPRGKTPKALARLLADQDVALLTPEAFEELSIAARGFYALEYLLFEPQLQQPAAYACALVEAGTADIARLSARIAADWPDYADQMRQAGGDSPYQTQDEVTQEFFKALLTGLQFTTDMRLGRPLGSFDRPRPKRAEARRSARGRQTVALAVAELAELAALLAEDDSSLERELAGAFGEVAENIDTLESPDLSQVSDALGWMQVDMVRLGLHDRIVEELMPPLGEQLGVPAGFNALDGD